LTAAACPLVERAKKVHRDAVVRRSPDLIVPLQRDAAKPFGLECAKEALARALDGIKHQEPFTVLAQSRQPSLEHRLAAFPRDLLPGHVAEDDDVNPQPLRGA